MEFELQSSAQDKESWPTPIATWAHHRELPTPPPAAVGAQQTVYGLQRPHHIPAASVAVAADPMNLTCRDSVVLLSFGVFAGCAMFSQQFHAWAHTPRTRLPPLLAALQDAGIILKPAQHAPHHRPPHNRSYCVVGGVWNRVLDRTKFFLALEVAVAAAFGHKPRSWTDDNSTSESDKL